MSLALNSNEVHDEGEQGEDVVHGQELPMFSLTSPPCKVPLLTLVH